MHRLLNLFSNRHARIICLVIAILTRSLMVYHYSEFPNYDEKAQLSVAFNLIRGHGLSEIRYAAQQPDVPVIDHTQRWPPGYSVIIAPFLILFNDNEFFASTCLDILIGILFIFLVLSLCKVLSVSPAVTNMAILVAGCFQYYIFIQSFPSDHLALVSMLAGLIACIKILRQQKKLSLTRYLFTSIIFFLPFLFRYMYLPVTVLFPMTLILFSFITKRRWLRINGFILLSGTILLSVCLLIWTKVYAGHYSYIVETEKGWFPEQLLHWYPFVLSAFLNIESVTSVISNLSSKSYHLVARFMEITNVLLLLMFFYMYTRKNGLKKYPEAIQFFLMSGIILSGIVIFLLGYLTLTNKPQSAWNYNIEGRYFVFPVIFLQLLFLMKYSFHHLTFNNALTKFFYSILLTVLLLESAHGIFSTIRNIAGEHANPFPTSRYLSSEQTNKIFAEIRKKYPGRDILLTSPNEYYLFAANNARFKPIYDFNYINFKQPTVTKNSLLITVLNDDDASYLSKYISERKPVKFAYHSFVSFFAEEINPLPPN